jgi:EAL and modified HD-GYP domain-containing signal transduction protein
MNPQWACTRENQSRTEKTTVSLLSPDLPQGGASPKFDCLGVRHPIYDRHLHVVGYEVLLRRGETQQVRILHGEHTTVQGCLDTFLKVGLDAIVGHQPAFIHFTPGVLLQDYVHAFPAERVVIEVREDITMHDELIEAVRKLAAEGYTIALDKFISREHLRQWVELADIIKLDVGALDRVTLAEYVDFLRVYDVKLLAEKVETYDELVYCQGLGFGYFQGFFFCQPNLATGAPGPANHVALLQLLAELQNSEVEFGKLEALISRDVLLSYKLLRVINTVFYSRPQKVRSIGQALLLLGTRSIAIWATLILLSHNEDKPHELLVTAMVRAQMCRQLAQVKAQADSDTFLLVGLFSVLDAMMDCPLPKVLAALPLVEDIAQALLHHKGILGTILHCVLAYERGHWEEVDTYGFEPGILLDAYLLAIAWATETGNALAHA